jgi:hypothetical protein
VVLYQMTTGRKPFLYDDMMQLIKAHLTETPLSLRELRPEVSPELQDVVMLALQKKRKDRFQSAEEFIEALRAVPEAVDLGGVEAGTSQVAASVRVRERLSGATSSASAASVGTAATVQAPGERSGLALDFDDEPLDRSMTTRARTGPQVLALLFFAVVVSVGTTYLLARYYPVADAGAPGVDSVARLIESGRLTEAERRVRKAIAGKPDDGRQHLLLGHIYSRKLWRKDAIKEYRRAIAQAPGLRSDPTMLRNVIGFLGKDKTVPRATRFLQRTVGVAAVPALKQASAEHTNPRVRRRAARALERIEGATE